MTVVFRSDAGFALGSGHLMRCIALAQMLKSQGWRAIFLCADLPDHLQRRLINEGFELHLMSTAAGSENDGRTTRALAIEIGANWVVIDGYHFRGDWYRPHSSGRPYKILTINDVPQDGYCSAEILVNPTPGVSRDIYSHLLPATVVLCGRKYILLRREFDRIVACDARRERRILVTLGGSDPTGLSARIVKWLTAGIRASCIRVVLGYNAPCEREIRAFGEAADTPVEVIVDSANMAEMIAWCDIGVTAAGSTTWEFCRLGRPMVHIVVADNQAGVADAVSRIGGSINLGAGGLVTSEGVCSAASRLLDSNELYTRASMACKRLVDGLGAKRMATIMHGGLLQIRRARFEDSEFLYRLATDPFTRQMSFNTSQFSFVEHQRWLLRVLKDTTVQILIGETNLGEQIGVIRFDSHSHPPQISVTIAPEMRGRRLAAPLISRCTIDFMRGFNVANVRALIKSENVASLKAFTIAGYDLDSEAGGETLILNYNLVET